MHFKGVINCTTAKPQLLSKVCDYLITDLAECTYMMLCLCKELLHIPTACCAVSFFAELHCLSKLGKHLSYHYAVLPSLLLHCTVFHYVDAKFAPGTDSAMHWMSA